LILFIFKILLKSRIANLKQMDSNNDIEDLALVGKLACGTLEKQVSQVHFINEFGKGNQNKNVATFSLTNVDGDEDPQFSDSSDDLDSDDEKLDVLDDFTKVKERLPRNFIKDQELMEKLVKILIGPDTDISTRILSDRAKRLKTKEINSRICNKSGNRKKLQVPDSVNLLYTYRNLVHRGEIDMNIDFEMNYRGKRKRTTDGVSSFTSFTSPFPMIESFPPL